MVKAVGLLSGGLDSTLSARIMLDQNIEVHAVNFTSPFCNCTSKNASCSAVSRAVQQLGNIPLKRFVLGDDYLQMVKNPAHGYGKGLNPCIDCRIMKIKKAGEYMKEIGASFLFTGEVLGQRPMSQRRDAIRIIDEHTGLGDVTVRPLSAQFFKPTEPERTNLIDRDKLLSLSGRNRKPQIAMAEDFGINDYPCPAGGCRLTDLNFANRLQDYFNYTQNPSVNDMALLKIGRHFRLENNDRIVITRDQQEGEMLLKIARPDDHLFVPLFSGPVSLLKGTDINTALQVILQYSGSLPEQAEIEYIYQGSKRNIVTSVNPSMSINLQRI